MHFLVRPSAFQLLRDFVVQLVKWHTSSVEKCLKLIGIMMFLL